MDQLQPNQTPSGTGGNRVVQSYLNYLTGRQVASTCAVVHCCNACICCSSANSTSARCKSFRATCACAPHCLAAYICAVCMCAVYMCVSCIYVVGCAGRPLQLPLLAPHAEQAPPKPDTLLSPTRTAESHTLLSPTHKPHHSITHAGSTAESYK